MTSEKKKVDFTSGPLLKSMILYALPIVGVNILQILFTTADVAVLGIFTNDQAVAAVGATAVIVNLMIGFFVGLSIAANVVVARCVGAREIEDAKKFVGTAVVSSLIFGFLLMMFGSLFAEKLLILTKCDPLVLPYATTYLRIYFLGMPIVMLYNFSAAILRAVGNTFKPFIFLVCGGVFNICLNIFFVVVIKIDVAGVAIATVSSQAVSAVGCLVLMIKDNGYAKLELKYLRIFKKQLGEILYIGLPLGISKCLFSFSNVLVQSNINVLGDQVMAANSITKDLDGIIAEAVHGLSTASLAIISQNYGAKNIKRIKKAMMISLALVVAVSLFLECVLILFGEQFCSIFTDTEAVVQYCAVRIKVFSVSIVVLGLLLIIQEGMRAIGYSFSAMLLSIFANIILRIFYLLWIYPKLFVPTETVTNLYLIYMVYPMSWLVCAITGAIMFIVMYNKVKKRFLAQSQEQNENN